MYRREDYEITKIDIDGSTYYVTRDDVKSVYHNPKLRNFREWFTHQESKARSKSLYYKGTALYFSFQGEKYQIGWVFYTSKMISKAVEKLKKLGAFNIQINWGELD